MADQVTVEPLGLGLGGLIFDPTARVLVSTPSSLTGPLAWRVALWDAATGAPVRELHHARDGVSRMAFDSAGVHLVSANWHWDTNLPTPLDPGDVAFEPELAPRAWADRVVERAARTKSPPAELDGPGIPEDAHVFRVDSGDWVGAAATLALSATCIESRDARTRVVQGPPSPAIVVAAEGRTRALSQLRGRPRALSRNGRLFSEENGCVSVVSVVNGGGPSPLTFAGTFVGLAPDDASLITRCDDGSLRTWDVALGRERTRVLAPLATQHAVAWLATGPLVAGLDQSTGELWLVGEALRWRANWPATRFAHVAETPW